MVRPRISRSMSAAFSSTLMCFDAAASEIVNGSCKLRYRPLTMSELTKHLPPRGIAEGVKHGTEESRF